ncbi:MAG: glycine--tRNA ligase subunit beta [Xanthomonadales bacterium]|nr:glycine--tRNA ligase subunit beta [Xanthomonadales bacterium]
MSDARPFDTADLLIELGCEELPPKALDAIRDAFFSGVCDGLEKNNLAFERATSRAFSTPRRIALMLGSVASGQPDQLLERRGPAVKAAFDESGEPTGAARGFARSVGKDVSELETLKTDKGEWLFCRVEQRGQNLDDLLFGILEHAIRQLPVPKPMRWGDHEFSFVRPVHWLVVLHGGRVIPGKLFGLESGRNTRGHRIHSPGPHEITSPADYPRILQDACVLAEHEVRRERIRQALLATDSNVLIDDALLDEVNNLIEWPVPVACSFEAAFLEVPHVALVASMQDHQKFFPVLDPVDTARVSNRFIAVSNLESRDPKQVREGYERVIRPRLADARFFFEQDRKTPLEAFLRGLDRVVFQQKIGTVGDKSRRIESISELIAKDIGIDSTAAERAALLAKCDLMSDMVGEFPELQGEMGRHYALASGESKAVAVAIAEHYAPRFAGDAIPSTPDGQVVGLADRADTLVGVFAAGLKPSGNKDPFALRRAALGMVRILLEAGIALPPLTVLQHAARQLEGRLPTDEALLDDVHGFVIDRLRHYYTEQDFQTNLVNAALASPWRHLPDLDRRLRALNAFMNETAASSLAASNKRIGNILRKADNLKIGDVDEKLLQINEEKGLFEEIIKADEIVNPLLEAGDYRAALNALANLRDPIDRFFDEVMVMDEDLRLRANRLNLLALLKSRFDRIANLSILG